MTFTRWRRRAAGVALGVVVIAAAVTWWPARHQAADTVSITASPGTTPVTVNPASGRRVALVFGDRTIEATLADTPIVAELAAMLPVTVEFSDTWGQAKTGRLPRPLTVGLAPRTLEPSAGDIYYWPDTATLVVYYDDLGQSVPPPGLVRLGALETDPAAVS